MWGISSTLAPIELRSSGIDEGKGLSHFRAATVEVILKTVLVLAVQEELSVALVVHLQDP